MKFGRISYFSYYRQKSHPSGQVVWAEFDCSSQLEIGKDIGVKLQTSPRYHDVLSTPSWGGSGTGSGGGGLPTLQNDLQSIASAINLSGVQKGRLEQALNDMVLLCGNIKLIGYLQSNNLKFGFSMNSSTNGVGGYNYQTGNISFMNSSSINWNVLQEELFHGYKITTMLVV